MLLWVDRCFVLALDRAKVLAAKARSNTLTAPTAADRRDPAPNGRATLDRLPTGILRASNGGNGRATLDRLPAIARGYTNATCAYIWE